MSSKIDDERLSEIVADVISRVAGHTTTPKSSPVSTQKTISIGADHRAQDLKEQLQTYLIDQGYQLIDHSQLPDGSTDYPDIAEAVARDVATKVAWRGVVIDGAGIGSCMAANKVPGARAALCYNQATAHNSREHNDANVLSLGSGLTGSALAQLILKTWLETPFAGGRHARRVDKIKAIEQRYQ